jgi:hypothetical protein
MNLIRSRTLVAVLALLLGASLTVGTAYAAPLTKKKVKAIAAAVVKNKAPTLSVAKAKQADNAAQLGGQDPSLYLDRVAFAEIQGPNGLATSDEHQVLNPTPLVVPPGIKYVHVSGSATMIGGDGPNYNFGMWIEMDGTCVNSGTDFNFRQLGNTNDSQDSVTVDRTLAVSAGNHSFRMCVQTGTTNMSVGARSLTVETVARNAQGN